MNAQIYFSYCLLKGFKSLKCLSKQINKMNYNGIIMQH